MPFFRGLALGERFEVEDCVPRQLAQKAARGEILAGPLPLIDYLRLQDQFERVGHFGIAVRGRAHSATLFGMRPIRQLDGATIAVTEETSTTACLLRLILEQRYELAPRSYQRGHVPNADALLLIGDEALRFRTADTRYPYETDLAFEWWLWQHRPFVFAVWAIRKDAGSHDKKVIESALARALTTNLSQLPMIATEYAGAFHMSESELELYLSNFVYRLGQSEEDGIKRFQELVNDPTTCAAPPTAGRDVTEKL